MKLDESLINEIFAETEDSQIERVRTAKILTSLEAGLNILSRLSRQKQAGQ